jgi:hypothetical protein
MHSRLHRLNPLIKLRISGLQRCSPGGEHSSTDHNQYASTCNLIAFATRSTCTIDKECSRVRYSVSVRTGPPRNLDNSALSMTHKVWEFILKCMHREIKMFHRDYDRQARLRTEDAQVSLYPAARLLLLNEALVVHLYVADAVFETRSRHRLY